MKERSHRLDRVADLIRQELSLLLERQVHDPRIGFVTITSVRLTPDLRTAHVAVSILGDKGMEERSLLGLAAAQGFLRRELSHRLALRHTPALTFALDRTLEVENRIEELLRQSQEKPSEE
jgi:ribosome-binding factor A